MVSHFESINIGEAIGNLNRISKDHAYLYGTLAEFMDHRDFDPIELKRLYARNQSLFYQTLELSMEIEKINYSSRIEKDYLESLMSYLEKILKTIKYHSRVTYYFWRGDNDCEGINRDLNAYLASCDSVKTALRQIKAQSWSAR